MMSVEYSWWNECPDAWRPLGDIVSDVWNVLGQSDRVEDN